LETLSHGQQSAVTALQYWYTEVQMRSKISNNRVAQYWNGLERFYEQVEQHEQSHEASVAEASRQEG
jgi:predicted secreted Zn-dependent protease